MALLRERDCTATDCTAMDCTVGLHSHGLHSHGLHSGIVQSWTAQPCVQRAALERDFWSSVPWGSLWDVTRQRRPRCHGAAGSQGFLDELQEVCAVLPSTWSPEEGWQWQAVSEGSPLFYFSAQSERVALGIPVPSPLADREGINLQQVALGGGRLELACCFLQAVKIKTITPCPPLQPATSFDPARASLGIGQDVPAFSQARQC